MYADVALIIIAVAGIAIDVVGLVRTFEDLLPHIPDGGLD